MNGIVTGKLKVVLWNQKIYRVFNIINTISFRSILTEFYNSSDFHGPPCNDVNEGLATSCSSGVFKRIFTYEIKYKHNKGPVESVGLVSERVGGSGLPPRQSGIARRPPPYTNLTSSTVIFNYYCNIYTGGRL